jgi:hypothetical protein
MISFCDLNSACIGRRQLANPENGVAICAESMRRLTRACTQGLRPGSPGDWYRVPDPLHAKISGDCANRCAGRSRRDSRSHVNGGCRTVGEAINMTVPGAFAGTIGRGNFAGTSTVDRGLQIRVVISNEASPWWGFR